MKASKILMSIFMLGCLGLVTACAPSSDSKQATQEKVDEGNAKINQMNDVDLELQKYGVKIVDGATAANKSVIYGAFNSKQKEILEKLGTYVFLGRQVLEIIANDKNIVYSQTDKVRKYTDVANTLSAYTISAMEHLKSDRYSRFNAILDDRNCRTSSDCFWTAYHAAYRSIKDLRTVNGVDILLPINERQLNTLSREDIKELRRALQNSIQDQEVILEGRFTLEHEQNIIETERPRLKLMIKNLQLVGE